MKYTTALQNISPEDRKCYSFVDSGTPSRRKLIFTDYVNEVKFQTLTDEIKSFDIVHPSIGENFSYLNTVRKKQDLELNFVLNEEDRFSWQFSNKGYFNFKNNIPKILAKFI